MIRKNSLKAWFLAARPKTLAAGASPVIVAAALAFHDGCFKWQPALICLVFAVIAQIISNFANDYFDYRKGSDNEERLGPKRAVAEGWISPKRMILATLLLSILNSVLGLSLLFYGGWFLIFVGLAVVIFALAYSGGPYPLAYHGWGDVCVFVFFGIVPLGFTYYVQAGNWPLSATICGTAVGLVVINILVANNYRDRFSDAQVGKNTSIVIFGERFGRYFYLSNGILAVLCCQYFLYEKSILAAVLPLIYLVLHFRTWSKMVRIGSGKELIPVLERTARNVLVFALSISLGLLLDHPQNETRKRPPRELGSCAEVPTVLPAPLTNVNLAKLLPVYDHGTEITESQRPLFVGDRSGVRGVRNVRVPLRFGTQRRKDASGFQPGAPEPVH